MLKDNAGRLALYTPDGTGPLAQYDVYTRLLPEPDCLALQQGVSIYTEAELQQNWKITACSPFSPVCACVAGHFMVHFYLIRCGSVPAASRHLE